MVRFVRAVLIGLVFASCNDSELVICPTVFSVISVEILDEGMNPVLLDRFETLGVESGITYDLSENYYSSSPSFYPVISDTQKSDIPKNGIEFLFNGYLNEQVVVSETFLIGKDDCRVVTKKGLKVIIVSLN